MWFCFDFDKIWSMNHKEPISYNVPSTERSRPIESIDGDLDFDKI